MAALYRQRNVSLSAETFSFRLNCNLTDIKWRPMLGALDVAVFTIQLNVSIKFKSVLHSQ